MHNALRAELSKARAGVQAALRPAVAADKAVGQLVHNAYALLGQAEARLLLVEVEAENEQAKRASRTSKQG